MPHAEHLPRDGGSSSRSPLVASPWAPVAFCSPPAPPFGDDDPDGGEVADPTSEVDPDNPFAIDSDGELEVFIFDGGFGDVYATDVHQPLFAARWPDVDIEHQADPDVAGVLQARFVGGDPPDVVNNSGGQRIDPAVSNWCIARV